MHPSFLFRYKERLRTKQIKTIKTTDTARSLVGKNWMFIKGGLDDFRDGLPPQGNKEIFLKVSFCICVIAALASYI